MTTNNQKLELSWMHKGEDLALEPRILQLQPEHCFGDAQADNMLIHGDNLLALKALEQEYTGKIKCIYIDPPYNTGNAFEHYDDMQEHSLWLNLMYHRLVLLRNLLHTEGSIWVTLDDNEVHYCKVMMDEIFGRANFVGNVIWEKNYSERMDAKTFSVSQDYILVYRKSENFQINKIQKIQNDKQFNLFDEKKQKFYRRRSLRKEGSESLRADRPSMWYPIDAPDGTLIYPHKPDNTEGRWRWKKENVDENRDELEFIKKSDRWEIYVKQFLEEEATRPPATLWKQEEVGHNHEAKEEVKLINKDDIFATPKPERLIERVLTLATKEGDIVLDSFLGSGTTAAVAHKMGRQWIGIELGDHAYTHCLPRLKKVVDGSDQGGISKAMNWTGGGGFKVYKLAESLLEHDENGILTLNPDFTDEMVAEAVAKIEGYRYNPTPSVFWQQAEGLDKSYLYVTKIFISRQWLDQLVEQIPTDISLLICCPAYTEGCEKAYKHIKLKKIPQAFQDAYDFDKNDYSLKVENVMPLEDENLEEDEIGVSTEGVVINKKRVKKTGNSQTSLF